MNEFLKRNAPAITRKAKGKARVYRLKVKTCIGEVYDVATFLSLGDCARVESLLNNDTDTTQRKYFTEVI